MTRRDPGTGLTDDELVGRSAARHWKDQHHAVRAQRVRETSMVVADID